MHSFIHPFIHLTNVHRDLGLHQSLCWVLRTERWIDNLCAHEILNQQGENDTKSKKLLNTCRIWWEFKKGDEHVYGVVSGKKLHRESDIWAECSTVLKVLLSRGWGQGLVGGWMLRQRELPEWKPGGVECLNTDVSESNLAWLGRATMGNEPGNGCWIWSPRTGSYQKIQMVFLLGSLTEGVRGEHLHFT